MARLEIDRVSKRYGEVHAVRDVTLDVADGEFVVLLGPSGCGKTTTLRVVAGFAEPTAGAVRLGARDITSMPPWKRNAGLVFQSYALFPHLTVAQNVAFGLEMRKVEASEMSRRIADALRLVRLEHLGERLPRQLSGGQQQRVALARALATSPGLLLLDEPLSALDARVRLRLRDEVKALQRRLGVTTVMVTHDQEEALAMADCIVVMNQGVIEQVGTPAEIYRSPTTAFVADFVGTMTFLDGEVTGPDRLRVGSIELTCTGINGFRHGDPVRVGLRPEEVRVRNIDASTPNQIATRISLLDFLGSFCRARLEPEAVPDMAILADFSTNLMRDLSVAEGQKLTIALPPESLRVFAK